MNRTIGLIRVSSVSQSDNTSLTNQKRMIQHYCELNGIQLDQILEEVVTGTTLNRDALNILKSKVESKTITTVIVYKIDRLMRSFSEGVVFIKFLLDNDIKIISTQEQIDTTTISGRFFMNILLSMSEMERNTIVQRLHTGKLQKFRMGHRCCGKIPYGYKKGENSSLVIDEKQSQIVKYIYRKWRDYSHLSSNMRTRRIRKNLRKRGFAFHGQPFQPYHLKQIVQNRFYIGEMTFGELVNTHQYDPIISKRLWNLCNHV